jgi:hypothetical protein
MPPKEKPTRNIGPENMRWRRVMVVSKSVLAEGSNMWRTSFTTLEPMPRAIKIHAIHFLSSAAAAVACTYGLPESPPTPGHRSITGVFSSHFSGNAHSKTKVSSTGPASATLTLLGRVVTPACGQQRLKMVTRSPPNQGAAKVVAQPWIIFSMAEPGAE